MKRCTIILIFILFLSACTTTVQQTAIQLSSIPAYSGEPYVVLNGNEPLFTEADYTTTAFEQYSELDTLGRCGVAYANICTELMPTAQRESISQIKPSGWHSIQYDFIDGNSLYNRCHLIGFQLAGENANEKNLITGTRYLNVDGMLPFENMVADYVKETNNHVLYRVTPIYDGSNLVASGVEMEASSVEDDSICFHVYVYNVQPGVTIDYATGESHAANTVAGSTSSAPSDASNAQATIYILNTSSHKFHLPTCSSVGTIKESNRQEVTATHDELIDAGYVPCKNCNP